MADDAGSIVIPFFALGANVLPGEPLPLHIFEPRYQKMIKYCLGENEHRRPVNFGISLTRPRLIEPIGCSVQIASVIKEFNDGRSMVMTWGESRYRLLEIFPETDFPRARVRFIEDLGEPVNPDLRAEVVELFAGAKKQNLADTAGPDSTSELISYQLAIRLNLEQAERQDLLNQPSEQARLERIRDYLSFQLKTVQHAGPLRAVHGYIQ